MKKKKTQLPLTQHFTIQRGKAIPSIDDRMRAFFEGKQSPAVDIPPGPTIEEAMARIETRKGKERLPHRDALERELQQDLGWIKTHLGEEDALRMVEKDWLIVGQTVFFASSSPSYEHVQNAVQELVSRHKKTTT